MNRIQLGDDNTRYFHQSSKQRHRSNRITHLHLNGVDITNPKLIQREFSQFYSNLFCTKLENRAKIKLEVARHGLILSDAQRDSLKLSFSKDEIKAAMWSIPDDKAPGLDDFNNFYKLHGRLLVMIQSRLSLFSLAMGRCLGAGALQQSL